MNILTIGSAPSTIDFFKNQYLDKIKKHEANIKTFAFQAAYPSTETLYGHTPDYWSWGDPDAAFLGLQKINQKINSGMLIPKIVIPSFLESVELFSSSCGTSQINRPHNIKRKQYYNNSIQNLKEKKLITIIPNSMTMRNISEQKLLYPTPEQRFSRDSFYFHTAPFQGIKSNHTNAFESKLTSYMFPLCFYLQAKNVYVLGFDHQGKGLNKSRGTVYEQEFPMGKRLKMGERVFNIINQWCNEWKNLHHMDIKSIVSSNHTRNNQYMNFVDIHG